MPLPCPYHIELKEVVCPPRKYPIHLKDEINEELSRMEELGVIEKIATCENTEWLNEITFIRKPNGKLRLCLDPRDLNTAIKRTYHRTPTIELISHKLANAKHFGKLDPRNGYLCVQLDNESTALTDFCSPSGQRYRFKRLILGIKVAQDVFQE